MSRQPRVRITSVDRAEVNIRLFVLALVELARELDGNDNCSSELDSLQADGEGES